MLDLTKFEGHTPGPWNAHTDPKHVDICLMTNAPDLLAEVKELREKIGRMRESLEAIDKACFSDRSQCDSCQGGPGSECVCNIAREALKEVAE